MFPVRDVYSGRFNPDGARATNPDRRGVPRRDISVHVAVETTLATVTEEHPKDKTEAGNEEEAGERSRFDRMSFSRSVLGVYTYSRTRHIV